jgi:hypothetical protein
VIGASEKVESTLKGKPDRDFALRLKIAPRGARAKKHEAERTM